jgi:hypothetical protein
MPLYSRFTYYARPAGLPTFDKPPFGGKFHAEAGLFFERAAVEHFKREKWRGIL